MTALLVLGSIHHVLTGPVAPEYLRLSRRHFFFLRRQQCRLDPALAQDIASFKPGFIVHVTGSMSQQGTLW